MELAEPDAEILELNRHEARSRFSAANLLRAGVAAAAVVAVGAIWGGFALSPGTVNAGSPVPANVSGSPMLATPTAAGFAPDATCAAQTMSADPSSSDVARSVAEHPEYFMPVACEGDWAMFVRSRSGQINLPPVVAVQTLPPTPPGGQPFTVTMMSDQGPYYFAHREQGSMRFQLFFSALPTKMVFSADSPTEAQVQGKVLQDQLRSSWLQQLRGAGIPDSLIYQVPELKAEPGSTTNSRAVP
ncbi:hypothetical protein [Psychromicrobium xiongbiense]|uniref:hypothetical protein n=1 Tax=Psychromicrobium xiongbiense TaxID=3051184 RepID=UPI0025525B22|nr:hypothetical protein [Psychromicrobium sp. YIM S02556]